MHLLTSNHRLAMLVTPFNHVEQIAMEITLRKYGNSTVVVLPPALLKELDIAAGQPMTLDTTTDGKIVLSKKTKYTLEDLVAQCDMRAPKASDIEIWDAAKAIGTELW